MPQVEPVRIFEHVDNKLQIRDIYAMYNHDWDILGEVIQNAVDAVLVRREIDGEYKPHIQIEFNTVQQTIRISDNGYGIPPEKLLSVVAPHFSGKDPKGTNRGEFGVGLAFVAFASNDFQITSNHVTGKSQLSIRNGYDWCMNEAELSIELEDSLEAETDTYASIVYAPVRFPLYTREKLIYVLQRFTAVGDFWSAFNNSDNPIKFTLTYISSDGKKKKENLPDKLWHPADYFGLIDRETVDYLELKAIDEGPRNTAIENMIGRGMTKKGKMTVDGKEFAYYALLCFGSFYRDLAEAAGVMGEEEEADDEDSDANDDSIIISPEIDLYPGIFVCKKGMPLGADVPRPPRAGTGLWSGFYIVVHSDSINTEPGRKKLSIKDERLVQSVAKTVFRDMERLSPYVISRNLDIEHEAILRRLEQTKRDMTEWIKTNALDNATFNISALVEPPNEQSLIALFHELLGSQKIKGYQLVKLSSTDTYDGLYNYRLAKSEIGNRAYEQWLATLSPQERRRYTQAGEIEEILLVIEFKLRLERIIPDFLSKSKYHPSIKLLIAWDADERYIDRKGWNLQKLPKSEVRYYGANYVLRPSSEGQSKGILATPVLLVKRFLDGIRSITFTDDTEATNSEIESS